MSTTPTPQPTAEGVQQQLEATQQALQEVQQQEAAPVSQKMVVETTTGQKFIGQTQAEVIAEMKKSIENASSELKRLHDLEKTYKQPPAPSLTPEQEQEQQAQKWMLDQVARGMRYSSADDMLQSIEEMREISIQMKNQQAIAQFHAKNEDFPVTDDAAGAITNILRENGWGVSVGTLEAAHAIALRRKLYEPAPTQQQQAPAVPQPIPTIGGSSASQYAGGKAPEDMTKDEILAEMRRLGGKV